MREDFLFIFNSLLLGAGLSMDAFSVSLANGLSEPDMSKKKICKIAGVFAWFQAFMPMTGWICVHTAARRFQVFEPWIPWIAFILLLLIGGKMLAEGIKNREGGAPKASAGGYALFIQGVATSIDALSVGFTIAEYGFARAIACACMIAAVTFFICAWGLLLGRKFGTRLSGKASVLGGVILILIGIEIFVAGIS